MMRAAVLFTALCMAGCAGLGASRQADHYFVLDGGGAAEAPATAHVRVAPTTAASFYDTQEMAFSRSAGTRGYYQFNHWTERPQHAIHQQLVVRLGRGPTGDDEYVLVTHVNEIYHDAVEAPGRARVSVDAELVLAKSKQVLASRTFTAAAEASSYDATGAVHGFDDALHGLLDDIVAWVRTETSARNGTLAAGTEKAR
jgi:cholesterol transport system auxiliary component